MKKMILSLLMVAVLLAGSACATTPREIKEAVIDQNGVLMITYTDGTQSELGVVVGKNGKDGVDGTNGADGQKGNDGLPGQNGKDGVDGKDGINGTNGASGQDGRGIQSITIDETGSWKITYDDATGETVETIGKSVLFAGMCGDTAAWVIYSGGLLMLGGSGKMDYAEGKAPWAALTPLLNAVYVDTSEGLTVSDSTLSGIDPNIVYGLYVWVDMCVSAPIYAQAKAEGASIAELPLGTPLQKIGEEGDFIKIAYGDGIAYIERAKTANQCGSVSYRDVVCQLKVGSNGANLRAYPDSYAVDNILLTIPADSVVDCTGISLNGNWYRVSYDGKIGYCYQSVVTLVEET